MIGRLLERAASIKRAIWRRLDADRDVGNGPLRRCDFCSRERHDIDFNGFCSPCSSRIW